MFRVVLTDYRYDSLAPFFDVFKREGVQFEPYQCATKEEILSCTEYADAVMTHFASIDRDVIMNLKNCKAIGRSAIGVDNIDVAAATERGLPVIFVPGYCVDDVSDHAMMMILALAKKLIPLHDSVRSGAWDYSIAKPVHRITGSTLGLMGFGAIARRVAEKARAFGMKVIAHDPFIPESVAQTMKVELVSTEELTAQSDFISLHTPLNDATKGMIDRSFFETMKPGAFLINTSRGAVIDERALIEALGSGHLGGVGLDVLADENIDKNSPLLQFKNAVITPHSGWYSEESMHTLLSSAAEDICNALKGRKIKGLYNKI